MSVNPLHRARIGNGIALREVAARTCLSPRIVQFIDAGEFERLPGGIYARSYVRAFATIVGLDPEAVIRELSDQLPPDEDPLPLLRENARASLPPFVKDLVRWTEDARTMLSSMAVLNGVPPGAGEPSRRMAALGVDISVLFAFYALLLRATAWIAGVDVPTALDLAGLQVAALSLLVGLLYFLLLGGILGRTLGTAACRMRASSAASPLGVRTICLRALSFSSEKAVYHSKASWDGDTHHLDPLNSRV